jgi:hypothetical protein
VDPSIVPFDFGSRHEVLKENQIMVDDLAITDESEISLCSSCHDSLVGAKKTPRDSLANYQWIGSVPAVVVVKNIWSRSSVRKKNLKRQSPSSPRPRQRAPSSLVISIEGLHFGPGHTQGELASQREVPVLD